MRSCSLLSSVLSSTSAGLRSDGSEPLAINSIWETKVKREKEWKGKGKSVFYRVLQKMQAEESRAAHTKIK